jgi:hypothetical protein
VGSLCQGLRSTNAAFGYRLVEALAGDSRAADRWETTDSGEYFAVGVGGAVTGRRADLAVIDDPARPYRSS